MGRQTLHLDIAIIGGGIAGLWTLNQLRNAGYSAVLFESHALGSAQTIGSQGMIHGGIKYALAGVWGGSSQAIAGMPEIWRQCLAGEGAVDLRGCKVLSKELFLWSTGDLRSGLASLFASKLLRGQIKKMEQEDYPAPLQSPRFQGQVYRLADLVVDPASLVATLARNQQDAIFQIDWGQASLAREGSQAQLQLADCNVIPQCLLLTAGAGNHSLMAELGSSEPPMQRRPLRQVLLRHEYREPLFGHCLGSSSSPRLTISSHADHDNNPVWYLGGDLATGGESDAAEQLIDRACAELDSILPWVDFGKTEWATVHLDRAEPGQSTMQRPDRAFVAPVDGLDNTLVAWPTKLTLTPDLANEICQQLMNKNLRPQHPQQLSPLHDLPSPTVALPYWDTPLSWIG